MTTDEAKLPQSADIHQHIEGPLSRALGASGMTAAEALFVGEMDRFHLQKLEDGDGTVWLLDERGITKAAVTMKGHRVEKIEIETFAWPEVRGVQTFVSMIAKIDPMNPDQIGLRLKVEHPDLNLSARFVSEEATFDVGRLGRNHFLELRAMGEVIRSRAGRRP